MGKKAGPIARQPFQAPYLRITLAQLPLVAIAFPMAWAAFDRLVAISLLCGAACALVPQGFFALRLAMAARHNAARLGLVAESGKFLLSAASFALVFAVIEPAHPGLVFVGFGALWLVQLIGAFRLLRAEY